MSRGHADALRAGAARSLPSRRRSARLPAPLWTPDSASRRRPPALLAASSSPRPPLSRAEFQMPAGRASARRGGSARPRRDADPEAGRTRGLRGPRLSPRLPEVRRDPEGAERAGLLPSPASIPLPPPPLRVPGVGGGGGAGGRGWGWWGPGESFFLATFGGS